MANSVFEINTDGTCIFCLNPNCAPLDRTRLDLTTSTALKILFRYLNIDIRRVAEVSVSTSSSVPITLDSSTNLVASLCEACFFLVDEFLELFQDFERIRLQLEACTWKLKEYVGTRARDEDIVREYRRRLEKPGDEFHKRFVDELRKETFAKCSVKSSSSIPKVGLIRRTAFPDGRVMLPQEMSSTRSEIDEELQVDFDSVEVVDQDVKREEIIQVTNVCSLGDFNTTSEPSVQVQHTNLAGDAEAGSSHQTNRKMNVVHSTSAKPTKKKRSSKKNLTLKKDINFYQKAYKFRHFKYMREHKNRFRMSGALKCGLCDRIFLWEKTLQRHYREVHLKIASKKGSRSPPAEADNASLPSVRVTRSRTALTLRTPSTRSQTAHSATSKASKPKPTSSLPRKCPNPPPAKDGPSRLCVIPTRSASKVSVTSKRQKVIQIVENAKKEKHWRNAAHRSQHKLPQGRPRNMGWTCPYCDKRYTGSLFNFKKHVECHEQVRDHPCSFPGCNWKFNNKEDMKTHRKIHLPMDQRVRFQCVKCGKYYTRGTDITRHMKSSSCPMQKYKRIDKDGTWRYVTPICIRDPHLAGEESSSSSD